MEFRCEVNVVIKTAGINLRLIQEYLGHNSAETTSLYTHLTSKAQEMASQVIHHLMEGL